MTFLARTCLGLFVLLILVVSFRAMAMSEELVRGIAIANACATCHGPDGRSQGAIPSIATMEAGTLAAALREFRSGTRQGTVMNRIAQGLGDAEIQAVAAHFASRQ